MRYQHLIYFFTEHSKPSTSLIFFSNVKIALAVPQILCLYSYEKNSNALLYGISVKGKNQDQERTVTIASSVFRLSSNYTGPFLLAELSRIG